MSYQVNNSDSLIDQNNLEGHDLLMDSDTLNLTTIQTKEVAEISPIWQFISIFELIIIVILLLYIKKRKKSRFTAEKEKIIGEAIDFENVITSAFNANELYDRLKVSCHPDKYHSDEKLRKIAEHLSQEINKNKTNFNMLKELENEAKIKLKIK